MGIMDKAKKGLIVLSAFRSLGKLEELVQQIVGIRGSYFPVYIKTVIIMCADNGVKKRESARVLKVLQLR